ncbi:MAG: Purine nucleoside phosphorylase 1 [Deltaproteobacteria bacterium ADurb.Bin058]|nr:MAG: Purine nucleoside phosphorylase 1 [Deltaproteobacteria bacterium ADurb.Bin058]
MNRIENLLAQLDKGPPAGQEVAKVARNILQFLGNRDKPSIAVILGSGLGGFEKRLTDSIVCPYAEVGLPTSTVAGHAGNLVVGKLQGKTVAVLAGRAHYYEGHDILTTALAVRALAVIGIKQLLVSNAAGGLRPEFTPGDFMLLTDHINMMGANPLRGPNLDALGPRFPDMTKPYDGEIIDKFVQAGKSLGIDLHKGTYMALSGPTYETPAEIRAFMSLGADAVGMSTVPEIIAARHAGVRCAAVSCITNVAAGLSDSLLSHDEVKEVGNLAGKRLSDLFEQTIALI